ncbi:MAG: YvcK family protein, partial [Sporichthya sp.]|nr:YvcK family protein [Sporichthya sp.]
MTGSLADAMGLGVRVLPMTEDEVTTMVRVGGNLMHHQEFTIRHHCEPTVDEVILAGAATATAGPGVLDALSGADVIIVAPSNPIASVDPVLALPGVRELLRRSGHVVAVSPIVAGVETDDPGAAGLPLPGGPVGEGEG